MFEYKRFAKEESKEKVSCDRAIEVFNSEIISPWIATMIH
jgi:hypothetical protein